MELGLTRNISNPMGRTVITWQKKSDLTPAQLSMSPSSRTPQDVREYTEASVPNPVAHKDLSLDARLQAAHEDRGEDLDTSHIEEAFRVVFELYEDLIIGDSTAPVFNGLPIYGLKNHPDRSTASFGTNGAWDQAAKTGANIIADIGTILDALRADKVRGQIELFVPDSYATKLAEDYSVNYPRTILSRILEHERISAVHFVERMSSGVIALRPTSQVVQIAEGMPVQLVQWEIPASTRRSSRCWASTCRS